MLIAKVIYLYAPYSQAWDVLFGFCLYSLAPLSIGLGLFNLIPIPPLDGSKVLAVFLPDRAYMQLMRYERYGIPGAFGAVLCRHRRQFDQRLDLWGVSGLFHPVFPLKTGHFFDLTD